MLVISIMLHITAKTANPDLSLLTSTLGWQADSEQFVNYRRDWKLYSLETLIPIWGILRGIQAMPNQMGLRDFPLAQCVQKAIKDKSKNRKNNVLDDNLLDLGDACPRLWIKDELDPDLD